MPTDRVVRIATAAGAVVGSGLLAAIGGRSGLGWPGGSSGLVLGGVLGRGAAEGWVGRGTVGGALFATIACLLGPGVDDHGGRAAIPAAIVGAVIGRAGWRFLLGCLTAPLGLALVSVLGLDSAGSEGGTISLVGPALGGAAGIAVGGRLERAWGRTQGKAGPVDPPDPGRV